MTSASPYVAVCGKCCLQYELHPVEQCPHEYIPIMNAAGERVGYRMVDKKKNKNGQAEEKSEL